MTNTKQTLMLVTIRLTSAKLNWANLKNKLDLLPS
uniref:Uncharacterized protein n=1 Tax=Anguilla anguilla TaxID=7936 RepID=A0A0E9WTU9_ANGAN